jgi:hypothetical protein
VLAVQCKLMQPEPEVAIRPEGGEGGCGLAIVIEPADPFQ